MGKSDKIRKIVRTDEKDYILKKEGTSKDYGGVDVYSLEELDPEPDPYYGFDFTRESIKNETDPSKNLYNFRVGMINNRGKEKEIFLENFMLDKYLPILENQKPLKLTYVSVCGSEDVKVIEDFCGIKSDCFGNKYALASKTSRLSEDGMDQIRIASLHSKEITPTEIERTLQKTEEHKDHQVFEEEIT